MSGAFWGCAGRDFEAMAGNFLNQSACILHKEYAADVESFLISMYCWYI
jgi:hypothetical protein